MTETALGSRKMVVLQEYQPSDNQGLAVQRGEKVQVISEEQNWFYVQNEHNNKGFVPSNYLMAPYSSMRSRTRTLGMPGLPSRHVASSRSNTDIIREQQQPHQHQQQQGQTELVTVSHLNSDLCSRKMVVLQEYQPSDDHGLAIQRGEVVQVIREEQNRSYVRNERNKEGFVPSNYLIAPYSSIRSRACKNQVHFSPSRIQDT